MLLESAFYWLVCLKFLFKFVTFPKSYARTKVAVFFLNTVYIFTKVKELFFKL